MSSQNKSKVVVMVRMIEGAVVEKIVILRKKMVIEMIKIKGKRRKEKLVTY